MRTRELITTALTAALAAALALSPFYAHATVQDQAQKEVEAMRKYAEASAERLVQNDFVISIQSALDDNATVLASTTDDFAELEKRKQDLAEQFSNFATKSTDDMAKSLESLLQLRDEYSDLMREKYTLTWISANAAASTKMVLPSFAAAVSNFEKQCRVGHSNAEIDLSMKSGPRYVPQWSVSVGYGTNGGSFDVKTVDPRAPERSQTLDQIAGVASTGASIAFSSGTPYGVAVGAVCVAIAATAELANAISASNSKDEIDGEMSRADAYRVANWADDALIGKLYREKCHDELDVLHPLQADLDSLLQGGSAAAQVRAKLQAQSAEMLAFEKPLKLVRAAWRRVSLRQKDSISADDAKDCGLTLPSKPGDAADQADQAYLKQMQPQMSRPALIKYAVWKTVTAFEVAGSQIFDQIVNASWDDVESAQNAAWNKLISFIAQVNQIRSSASLNPATQELVSDIKSRQRIGALQSAFVHLTAVGIQYAFNRVTASDWANARADFEQKSAATFRDFQYLPAISGLQAQYKKIVSILEDAK